jgi:cytochrome c biogenesis protein ResB
MPIAKLAKKMLCQRLGIVAEGQAVTEDAIAKFVQMFQGHLPDIAVAALRALFRLDCDFATAVEDALMEHGGAAAVDHAGDTATEAVGQA